MNKNHFSNKVIAIALMGLIPLSGMAQQNPNPSEIGKVISGQAKPHGPVEIQNEIRGGSQRRSSRLVQAQPANRNSLQNSSPRMKRGGVDSGGGDAITDPNGKRSLLDLVEIESELKPFKFRAGDYEPEFGRFVDKMGRGDLAYGVLEQRIMRQLPASVRRPLHYCLNDDTGLRWSFTDVPLEEIQDEGVIHLDNIQSKRQVAIQIGNQVIVNRQEFDAMDDLGRAGLKLHEGLLCAAKGFNPYLHQESGTEAIRRVVRAIAKTRLSAEVPFYVLADAIKELNAVSGEH